MALVVGGIIMFGVINRQIGMLSLALFLAAAAACDV